MIRTKHVPLSALLPLLTVGALLTGCDRADTPTDPGEAAEEASAMNHPSSPAVSQGHTGTGSAMVRFGHHEAGSPFPPAVHDESFHAKDKIVPRNVTIDRGGSVTFRIGPFHQVAVFEPGTRPEDIDASQTTSHPILPPPLEVITYDDGQVVRSPGPSGSHLQWTTPGGTFDEPGRYLMICTTNLHFLEADMYGWITVR